MSTPDAIQPLKVGDELVLTLPDHGFPADHSGRPAWAGRAERVRILFEQVELLTGPACGRRLSLSEAGVMDAGVAGWYVPASSVAEWPSPMTLEMYGLGPVPHDHSKNRECLACRNAAKGNG